MWVAACLLHVALAAWLFIISPHLLDNDPKLGP